MRVLIIAGTYFPNTTSIAKMVHDLATEIAFTGHSPVILVPDPTIDDRYTYVEEGKISVLRVKSGKIKNTHKVKRAINELRLSASVWKNAEQFFLNNKFDLIVFVSPSIFWGKLVKKLKELWNCKAYMVLRDIFPQWSVDAGVLKENSLIYKFFKFKELQQYNIADVIGVQSPANIDYFKDTGLFQQLNIEILYNWVAVNSVEISKNRNLRKQFGLENKVVFFYGGRFGPAQDIDNIIRLAENLKDSYKTHFLLVGDGPDYNRIEKIISAQKLTNITIHPAVAQPDYLSMLSEFDVGIITLDKHLTTHNFPGKLLAYLQFSKPVIASINPGNDLYEILEENKAGLVSLNGDDNLFKTNALKLAADDGLRQQLGNNGFSLIENVFSVKTAWSQISSILDTKVKTK